MKIEKYIKIWLKIRRKALPSTKIIVDKTKYDRKKGKNNYETN